MFRFPVILFLSASWLLRGESIQFNPPEADEGLIPRPLGRL